MLRRLFPAIVALAAVACTQVTDPPPAVDAGVPDASGETPDASVEIEASTELTAR